MKKLIPEKLYQKIVNVIPVCCVDLVIKKNNQFLLVKRLEDPARNKWWFPGGRVLFNESLKNAVKRKLREELNIRKLKEIKFLGVGETRFKRGRFGRPVYTINMVFLVKLNKNSALDIRPDKTIAGYQWFKNAPKGLHPYLKKFIKLAK